LELQSYGLAICTSETKPNTGDVSHHVIYATMLHISRPYVVLFSFTFAVLHRILQLADAFKDFATENMGGKGASSALMTHCRREVLHAQWNILLDEEFIDAYQRGIVVDCCDGITRRFYPRLLTYSADYPEKYFFSRCLCLVSDQFTWLQGSPCQYP